MIIKKRSILDDLINSKGITLDLISVQASRFIDLTYKINAIFIYSYSHIAITSIYLSFIQSNLGINDVEFFNCFGISKWDELIIIINQIKNEIEKLIEINELEVKKALKTVMKFKKYNPDYYKELEKQKK